MPNGSITIYKLICMHYNQFETYQFKNKRTKKQLYELQNPIIKINELRKITDTENEYTRFTNFERFVLKTAIDEINKFTHLDIKYDKIKTGRSITDIQFHIEKKPNWADEEYKRDDEVAKLSVEQRQQQNDTLFAKGISSTYTAQLITNNLITAIDMMNQETIISLSKHVYPIYDELVKVNGEKALTEHLGYVSDNMVDYTASKKNIVKYLQISAQQYLDNGVGTIIAEKKQQRTDEKKATKRKLVKEVPEWSNTDYIESTSDEEKAKFAEWQKNMRNE